jgi:hypothetical protein
MDLHDLNDHLHYVRLDGVADAQRSALDYEAAFRPTVEALVDDYIASHENSGLTVEWLHSSAVTWAVSYYSTAAAIWARHDAQSEVA